MSLRTISQRRQVITSLEDKEYRDFYVGEHIDQGLAFQVRATRDERGWTQAELASRIGSGQSAISKLEDSDYGRQSLTTLKKLASAFDVALIVRFVPFSDLVNYTSNLTPDHLAPVDFARDAMLFVSEFPGTADTTSSPVASASTQPHQERPISSGQLPFDFAGTPVTAIADIRRADTTPNIAARTQVRAAGGYRQ